MNLMLALCLTIMLGSNGLAQVLNVDTMNVDELFAVLNSHPDDQQRVQAARWIAWRMGRPTPEQVRYLVSTMRADKSPSVRGAVASTIGRIASRKVYRVGRRTLPYELREFINGLRECYRYEPKPFIRIALIEAVSEFDHNEAQVILNMGKGDIDQEVRQASYDAERRRENRLRDSGYLNLNALASEVGQGAREPTIIHIGLRNEKLSHADQIIAVRIVPEPESNGKKGKQEKERRCIAKVLTQYCHSIPSYPAPQQICYWREETVPGTWNEKRKCCEVFARDGMFYCVKDGIIWPPVEVEEPQK